MRWIHGVTGFYGDPQPRAMACISGIERAFCLTTTSSCKASRKLVRHFSDGDEDVAATDAANAKI